MSGWGDLEPRELDALQLLAGDALKHLNAYWDYVYALPENVYRSGGPTRLAAIAWLECLQARLRELDTGAAGVRVDVTPWRKLAGELLQGVGTFAVVNAARIARGEQLRGEW